MNDYLFVCSANLARSPTAEHVARFAGFKAASAGSHDWSHTTVNPLTADLIHRANNIICMEEEHAFACTALVPPCEKKIQIWNVPDIYDYCEPELILIIRNKLGLK